MYLILCCNDILSKFNTHNKINSFLSLVPTYIKNYSETFLNNSLFEIYKTY